MSPKRIKYLQSLRPKDSKKINELIDKLKSGNFQGLYPVQLKGKDNERRVRYGKFRILYFRDGNTGYIIKIGVRGDIYK